YLSPLHLAVVLFQDKDGTASHMCSKMGVSVDLVRDGFENELAKLPTQEPAPDDVAPNKAMVNVLRGAEKIQKDQGDSMLAVDHLIIALTDDKDVMKVLQNVGL